MELKITYIIIGITVLVSVLAFTNRALFNALALKPWDMTHRNQWYRLLTHVFVHADYNHLIVNMFVFWSFGVYVENILQTLAFQGYIASPIVTYCLLYFGGAVVASVYDAVKYRNNPYYTSIGASGAVSAVLFFTIFFNPWGKIYFFGILPIWGILFGVLYIYYCWYMQNHRPGNINHYAHLWGALYGFILPVLINPQLIGFFLDNIRKFS